MYAQTESAAPLQIPASRALPPLVEQRLPSLARQFALQRESFARDPQAALALRRDRLDRLLALVEHQEAEIIASIHADFGGRSAHETRLGEVFVVRAGIRHARRHLARWMRPQRIATALHFLPGHNRLLRQPLGVVGIVSPWNYPLQLSLGPALAALAAGNRVLLKPSELTPSFSALLQRLVAHYFAPEEMAVIPGDAEVGRAFVALPFDHLLFTGSTAVGRQVAQAAAANLTPVTLELGGKSPVILDHSADMAVAATRIAFGKCFNAGQTCIAPDYLLVPRGQATRMAELLKAAISRHYPRLLDNPDYTSIISPAHRQRLLELLADARQGGAQVIEVNPAGERFEEAAGKLPPTLLTGVAESARLMQEEIFGPLLPIVEYDDLSAAILRIQQGARPLALYWFGRDRGNRERVLRETHAGGVTLNDCLWHLAQEAQPFGGIGPSGMGAYHGEWGFRTFSKEKPVFYQARWNGSGLLHPPYGRGFERLLGLLKRIT